MRVPGSFVRTRRRVAGTRRVVNQSRVRRTPSIRSTFGQLRQLRVADRAETAILAISAPATLCRGESWSRRCAFSVSTPRRRRRHRRSMTRPPTGYRLVGQQFSNVRPVTGSFQSPAISESGVSTNATIAKARVRHDEPRSLDGQVAVQDQVEIERARRARVRAFATVSSFDVQKRLEEVACG